MTDAQLSKITAITEPKQKVDQYKTLITELVGASDVAGLKSVVSHLVGESVPLVVSRQALTEFADAVTKLPHDAFVAVGEHSLKALLSRIISFEEQFSAIAEKLAALYEKDGKYRLAAETLSSIPLDSGQRVIDEKYRANIYVTIAENFLRAADGDWASAEKALNRAGTLEKSPELNFRFKVSFATILDFKKRFLDVIRHYYEIAHMAEGDQQKYEFMEQAIAAAVLSEAGPQRSRWLNILYKDEFSSKTRLYSFLESVYLEKILRGEQVKTFASLLKPHHVEKSEGESVLEIAMVQHNLLAASRIYNNISFEQMGALLQIPSKKAEKICADMIMTNRLAASIDQIQGVVTFEAARATLPLWDTQIESTCHTVDRVIFLLQRSNPALAQGL